MSCLKSNQPDPDGMTSQFTEFPRYGRQLFVGEGDFSLTVALRNSATLPDDAMVTCFASQLSETASRNMQVLQQSGIQVLTGIDATGLRQYDSIAGRQFDLIVFNFPHTGHKMKIHKCRHLLREFLLSAIGLLAPEGHVWVTLCAGQGGTPADTVQRDWGDTWQLIGQAAAAGLVLSGATFFNPQLFHEYKATGNRGRESRTFHSKGGVTHVLSRGQSDPISAAVMSDRLVITGTADRASWRFDAHAQTDAAGFFELNDYWRWRLEQADGDCVTAAARVRLLDILQVDGRVYDATSPWKRGRVYLRTEGLLYRLRPANYGDVASCSDGAILGPVSDMWNCDQQDHAGCLGLGSLVYLIDDDCPVAAEFAANPFASYLLTKDDLRSAQSALEVFLKCDSLFSFGLEVENSSIVCRETGNAVFEVRNELGVYHMDFVAACWAHVRHDWRHVARVDFHVCPKNGRPVFRSLYPLTHQLDTSFWLPAVQSDSESVEYTQRHLYRALRGVWRHLLISVSVLDEYEHPDTGRRAVTLRLRYQDLSSPLSAQLARDIHVHTLPGILGRALRVSAR